MFGRSREKKAQVARKGQGGWYVEAAGRVWGPYAEDRIEHFIGEGRVAADTPLAMDREGPFTPAERCGRFKALFPKDRLVLDPAPAPRRPPETERAYAPAPAAAAAAPAGYEAPRAPEGEGSAKALLVWAQLAHPQGFEAALGAYGPTVRVEKELWLLRARIGSAALRNALSRRLEADDMLMVVEAPLNQAAWFNLDDSVDRALRQLWLGGGEG